MTDGFGIYWYHCIVGRDDISNVSDVLDVDSWVRLPVIFQRFSSKIGPFNGYFSTILAFLGAVCAVFGRGLCVVLL